MALEETNPSDSFPPPESVELKDPLLAALLAWLWPGAGHIYQGRIGKGLLYMICIMGTFLYGFDVGGRKVVYASWDQQDRRYAYLCQFWVGLPAMPALLQSWLQPSREKPLWGGLMAPPSLELVGEGSELSVWHRMLSGNFEIGTAYTMIAGLLNLLAIFDAGAGPILPSRKMTKPSEDDGEEKEETREKE